MGHVPWLGSTAFSIPGVVTNFKMLRKIAQNLAKRRIQQGSRVKDVFYHLVRCILSLLFCLFFFLTKIIQMDEDNVFADKPTLGEVASDGMYGFF